MSEANEKSGNRSASSSCSQDADQLMSESQTENLGHSQDASLLPCPFCGGPVSELVLTGNAQRCERSIWCVRCDVEFMVGGASDFDVIDWWNTRAAATAENKE